MKYISLLIAVLLLVGCSRTGNTSLDDLQDQVNNQNQTITLLNEEIDNLVLRLEEEKVNINYTEKETFILIPNYLISISIPIVLPEFIEVSLSEKGINFSFINEDSKESENLLTVSLINNANYNENSFTIVYNYSDEWFLAIVREIDTNLSDIGREKCSEFLDSVEKWEWN
ncbi:hypothetical protein AOC36_11025 [Erysipelothrix larvae]|uniref:Lipoprotein n=1 Tax=Erysipelothrix larvae TaxID=1514105 RepID=A0A109UHM6_9FIRM|nr:hypothetical protein [Erysipelothrix larvae]AMC94486.1 hypothetical protein AOC36_11025 [Erysipelothrix larvae]